MLYTPSKQTYFDRDFPEPALGRRRRAVCKRCHCVMEDFEPCAPHGDYTHATVDKDKKPYDCPNAGKNFSERDLEIVPFLPKRRRRALKRLGVRP